MRYFLALLLSLALAIPAFAAFDGPGSPAGGFNGPGPKALTQAAQVADAPDDTPCVLEGNVLEKLRKDKYLFQDASGRVTVEIDGKVFGGNTVTPESRVKLTGEVEHKRRGGNEVDVHRLELVK